VKNIVSLHVHSCFASVSSGDVFLYKLVDHVKFHPKGQSAITNGDPADMENAVGIIEFDGQAWPLGEVNIEGDWIVWYIADTTFYWDGLRNRRSAFDGFDIQGSVDTHKANGFGDRPSDYAADVKAIREAKDTSEIKRRTEDGYVFPVTCFMDTAVEMQGGFSDEVFNHPALIDYLSKSKDGKIYAHGYIGNSNRRKHLDRFLEFHLRSNLGWSVDEVALWLTSSYGRHFCDSYEQEMDCLKRTWTKC